MLNSFSTIDPQEGHLLGNLYLIDFEVLFFKSTETTCGITSPALSIFTTSPILISFFLISSSLCNVAFETTTPPIFTGSTFATGVKAPVLPICTSIFKIFEKDDAAENLWAVAHLGALPENPNLF